ncbi:MAG TPA: phosphoribosylformylglycinamidine cyclo-ligase [Planctomycetota bacterium]|nr:phosphoribosylformylglycinamidine cyclo-ligase [Planctomycetota bacterium]
MTDMKQKLTYKDAGVDIHAGDEIADNIGKLARSTYGPEVIGGVGGFAGLFSMGGEVQLLRGKYKDPVLVACTDGVGTKLKIAFMSGRHNTVGIDLVAMSVNDLIVQGAEPLFFLDYIGIEKKDPQVCHDLMLGIVEGCRQSGCALLGGETASLPSMYMKGEYDLAGFCVGVIERSKIIDGKKVGAGDVVIGVHSSGLHSNGYSLVRKALLEVGGLKLDQHIPELNCKLVDELMKPTTIYAKAVREVLSHYKVKDAVHSMANITGSGLPGNIPRTVPNGFVVKLKKGSWKVPPIFTLIQSHGDVDDAEMFDTFNMGIGMTIICPPHNANVIQQILRDTGLGSDIIGKVEANSDPAAEAFVVFA